MWRSFDLVDSPASTCKIYDSGPQAARKVVSDDLWRASSEGHSFTASLQCASKAQYLDNGDFRSGEIEIKETLIAVVLNSANCTVLWCK
jgi:hypothetical protein